MPDLKPELRNQSHAVARFRHLIRSRPLGRAKRAERGVHAASATELNRVFVLYSALPPVCAVKRRERALRLRGHLKSDRRSFVLLLVLLLVPDFAVDSEDEEEISFG